MTSKQALLKLCFKYLPTIDEMHLNPDEEDEELLNIIQKDLETLELLKNECGEIVFFFESSSKVREWYDNEKRRN